MAECPDTPWDGEVQDRLPEKIQEQPAAAALYFLEFLKSKGIETGRLVDLGCGKGRNSVFFAKNHFEVHAIDKKEDIIAGLDLHGVKTYCQDVSEYLLFEDFYFDFGMDIDCYEDIADERRNLYKEQIRRVIKPDGFFLISLSKSFPKEKLIKDFSDFNKIEEKEDENSCWFIFRL